MSNFSVNLDEETASAIAIAYLTNILDDPNNLPEGREVEFAQACQEVLHYIMIPQQWEKRFDHDFVEYSKNAD